MRRLNYSLPMLLILILVFAFSGCTQSGNDVAQPDVDTEETQSAESTTGLPTQDTTESTTEEGSSEAPDSNEPVPRDISVAQDKSLLAYLIPNEDSEISTDTYTLVKWALCRTVASVRKSHKSFSRTESPQFPITHSTVFLP